MPTFKSGDIVRVPFPYTNRDTTQHRPALVISNGPVASGMLLWVLMITSSANRGRAGDVNISSGFDLTGLPSPSMVRTAKIATIESDAAERIGSVAEGELASVWREVGRILPAR